jgi:flagellar motor switch protein FliM
VTDVLDQAEVDALLAAVDTGQVQSETPGQVFGSKGKAPLDVQIYDFKRPERVSKDQMRALEALHEGFGRNLGAALSGYLRTIIEVSVAQIEQLTYSEFIHSLPNPTCFNLLKAEQLDGQLCLEISPLIVYPIIDRLLGGSNADLFIPQRPLTQIEQRLVQRITDRATHHLSEAWSNLTPLTFSVQDFESNPQLVQIVPPNETVVVVGFDLKMGNRTGTMSLCIPYNVIEPIMGLLAAQNWFSYQRKGATEDFVRKLTRNVNSAAVEMRAFLARTTIRMSDLLSLRPGDIITTERPCDSEAFVQVEGKLKFLGRVGQLRGNRALCVTKVTRDQTEPPTDDSAKDLHPPAAKATATNGASAAPAPTAPAATKPAPASPQAAAPKAPANKAAKSAASPATGRAAK